MRHSSHLRHHMRLASHHLASHHYLAGSHHTHLASGSPGGFGHGNASWKQNGGTPPGWSHGNKTGWGCTPGSSRCMPPGLAKKQANSHSHTRTASHIRHARHTNVSLKNHSHTRLHSKNE